MSEEVKTCGYCGEEDIPTALIYVHYATCHEHKMFMTEAKIDYDSGLSELLC